MQIRGFLVGDGVAASMNALPDEWLDLSSYQRDILLVCYHDGPLTGATIFECVGDRDGRRDGARVYRNLDPLTAEGLLETKPHPEDNRSKMWDLSDDGTALLSRVSECWDEV